jgi:hypothetical protein
MLEECTENCWLPMQIRQALRGSHRLKSLTLRSTEPKRDGVFEEE